jgi:hypothetical protein
MVVIMEYDMTDNGIYNSDSKRKNQERRTRLAAP